MDLSMLKPIKITLFGYLLVSSVLAFAQRDPLYNQYQFNQLMINPAYAGIYNRFSVGMINRFQWVGIEGAPITNTLTAQSALNEGKIGVGAVLLNDKFGVSDNYELQLMSSYNILMPQGRIAMGLQGGFIRYGFDFSKVEVDFLDDPEIFNGQENFQKPNFGVGMMYLSETFFIGASIPRILNVAAKDGSLTSERYKRHYYLSGGLVFEANRWSKIKLLTLLRSVEGERISADLMVSANLDGIFWTGFSTRDLKHFGLFINMLMQKRMRIGYSFELPTSSMIRGSYGTHELSLLLEIVNRRQRRRRDRFPQYF